MTNTTSLTVIDVSAIFDARMIFLNPAGADGGR